MNRQAVFVLLGIAAAAVLFGGGYFMHKCPKPVKPIPTAQIPEVKPAQTKEPLPPKPVTRWEKETVLDVATLNAAEKAAYAKGLTAGWKQGWDSCASAHHAFLVPERFTVTDTTPHTKDSITFWPLADTFSVIHMGIIPTVLTTGKQESRRHNSLLHFGFVGWFDKPFEMWGTLPVPKDRRAFYFPDRGGINYQPKGKIWKLAFEWEAL